MGRIAELEGFRGKNSARTQELDEEQRGIQRFSYYVLVDASFSKATRYICSST